MSRIYKVREFPQIWGLSPTSRKAPNMRKEENASVLYRSKRGISRRLCRKYGGIKIVLFGMFSAQKNKKVKPKSGRINQALYLWQNYTVLEGMGQAKNHEKHSGVGG